MLTPLRAFESHHKDTGRFGDKVSYLCGRVKRNLSLLNFSFTLLPLAAPTEGTRLYNIVVTSRHGPLRAL